MFMELEEEVAKEMGAERENNLKGKIISEDDISSAFKAVDIDKSGEISKRVRQHSTHLMFYLCCLYRSLKWPSNTSASDMDSKT